MNRFVIAIIAVIVFAALYTGGWLYAAGLVQSEIEAFETADGITSPRLICDDLGVGGFPFQFHPHCTGVDLMLGDYHVELARLDATALIYRPSHIQLFAEGPARITDSFLGSVQELSWRELRASLRLDDGNIGRLSIVGSQLAHVDALLDATVLATFGDVEFHLVEASAAETPTAGQTLDLYASADDADIPALDLASGTLVVDGRVTGLPDLALIGGPEGLRLWQQNGGMVELRMLDADARGVALDASGEAALDETGRLDGRFEITSRGVAERLSGLLDPELAELMLGTPGEDGQSTQTVTMNAGTVQIGIIPVQTLPPFF